MLTSHLSRRHLLALTAAAALLLAGCGGGGSIDGTGSATTPSAQGTLSGNVVKGPVSGATVKAFSVSGGVMGAQISSAVTDANGAFTVPMGNYTGPVMLQMGGGTYIDTAEIYGAVLALDEVVAGRREQLAGKIPERYGVAKEEAERQLAAWERKASDSWLKK